MFGRFIAFLYGLVCYLIFLVAFLYAIAFVGNIGLVPKTIDSGPAGPLTKALIINAVLLSLFAIMTTAYILVAIQFEERDLIRFYGDNYRKYREQVSMLFPLRLRKR